ncbi:DgyrCDS10780 [Dimorphilus gyrociliatus]|uniref:DgyrCDS10780 n=1 Tax=Dimorphilus gyrociliatus TaxID=2664684 RepID=A0A7I8W380_9ANNE|nr:DgyrCDS10780 [Dimorphilus gyrociliatus]
MSSQLALIEKTNDRNIRRLVTVGNYPIVKRSEYFGISINDIESYRCKESGFLCPNDHICINVAYVCDGKIDCPSGGDENNCTILTFERFQCLNSIEKISYTLVCNFIEDCPDKSDELYCEHQTCIESSRFQCNNHQCIKFEDICNNERNCFDESDELCNSNISIYEGYQSGCNENRQFSCDGHCLPLAFLCDGKYSCKDKSDREVNAFEYKRNLKLWHSYPSKKKDLMMYDTIENLKTPIPYIKRKVGDKKINCGIGKYLCQSEEYCISIQFVCDGVNHCLHQDDEQNCGLS